jgi:starvation-inducible DNA-binding protein
VKNMAKVKQLLKTRHSLAADVRERIVDRLNDRLSTLTDLHLQAKMSHWNLRGAGFIAYHEMLDALVAEVQGYADMAAERIVQLGGLAEGNAREVAASGLKPWPAESMPFEAHVEHLADRLGETSGRMREDIGWAAGLGDDATADLLTETVRGLDVWLWKVEAHLTPSE